MNEPSDEWSPHPLLPQDPEFYRRVLDHLPTAVLIVDAAGTIKFGNMAMLALARLDVDQGLGTNLLEYVHPDDRDWVTEAFLEITAQPSSRVLTPDRPWAEVFLRFVAADGTVWPVEVIGTGGVLDTVVGGVIYEVRTAQPGDMLTRLLDGFTLGASQRYLFSLVVDLVERPPLDLHAAILKSTTDGGLILAACNHRGLANALTAHDCDGPWSEPSREVCEVDVNEFHPTLSAELQGLGLRNLWYVSVESPISRVTLRILIAAPMAHLPATGVTHRAMRARELAGAILVRSETDYLFDEVASINQTTDLPNLRAFRNHVDNLDPTLYRSAVQIQIDGLSAARAQLGQVAQDQILQIVVDRLRSATSPTDVVGQVGREGFTCVLAGQDRSEVAARAVDLARSWLADVAAVVMVAGRTVSLTASAGVAHADPHAPIEELLNRADDAFQQARSAGANQIHISN